MKIIDGREIARKIEDEIVKKVVELKGKRPNLAIVLVGERKDSELYVKLKERTAKEVGVDTHLYKCPINTKEEEIIGIVEHLNKDDEVDAILVQLPLPRGFNSDKIINKMDPRKDVDRFHSGNLKILRETCDHKKVMPPVFAAVLKILEEIDYELEDKKICIIANSDIFGDSLAKVLKCLKAKVKAIGADDDKLVEQTAQADVLISAVGKPEFIKKDMIKEGAVIIDIGVTRKGKKVVGDVDFNEVIKKASYITPVPGGVGPMTVAMLLKNTVELVKNK